MRDIRHFAEIGRSTIKQKQRYDLCVGEIKQLFDIDNQFDRIEIAYLAGFEAGMRCQIDESTPIDID